MIELAPEQLLQIVLAFACATVFAIALIFVLLVAATGHRRARGWTWGWFCAALTFGLAAATVYFTREQYVLSLATTVVAALTAFVHASAVYRFAYDRPAPRALTAAVWAGAAIALFAWVRAAGSSPLLGAEVGLCMGVTSNAIALYPWRGDRRRGGARAVFIMSALLSVLMLRTLLSALVLSFNGEALSGLYWAIEVTVGISMAGLLALSEVIAILDELRLKLLDSNESLGRAMVDLETAAKVDSLTGLHNRYAFYTLIEDFIEMGGRGSGCIAILDLNNLKRINDTFGHHAGDQALLSVARRLKEIVRSSDHVFRWGGDEFVVVLTGTTVEKARERFMRMQAPEPIQTPKSEEPLELALSWGVARLRKNVDAALREADAQLYAQKNLVKNFSNELSNS
jgi:diguanylate cyclase (GGDEF)-like protein